MGEMRNPARGANEWNDVYGNLGIAPQAQLTQLPPHILDPWEDSTGKTQPFKPYSQDKLEELAENIRKHGVIEPICVRPMPTGRFQIIAGHNRVAAAKLAGLRTVPALVQQLTDDQAAVLMVDSNLQHREKLLPSEKAFAYRLRLESLKKQGKRTDLTCAPLGHKLEAEKSRDIIAKENGEGREQIRRYIRLTYLEEKLLELVDNDKFALRAAVEISYIPLAEQRILLQVMEDEKCKAPSMAQAAQLRDQSQKEALDHHAVISILKPVKAAKVPTVKLPAMRITSFFPQNTSPEVMEEEIYHALLAYRNMNNTPASV